MKIFADTTEKTISTEDIYYLKGAPSVRQYDSCFYEIGMSDITEEQRAELLTGDNNAISINVRVTKASEMNAYLYGGADRYSATMPIVQNNEQVSLGHTYKVDSETGFLLVAYPNTDVDTEFEFTYTLEGYYQVEIVGGQPDAIPINEHIDEHVEEEIVIVESTPILMDIQDEETAQVSNVIQDFTDKAVDHVEENPVPSSLIGAGVFVFLFSSIAFCIYRRNKNRVVIQVDDINELSAEQVGTESPRAPGEQNSSVQLESVGDDDEGSKNVGVSKSNMKSNHEDSIPGLDVSSDRSGIEAREGGEKIKSGNRYSLVQG